MERTVILYHSNCPDGFGGAYAAWKKFGDSAEYIELNRSMPAPDSFADAHLYFIDFCYPKEMMDVFVQNSLSLTMLDHHEGVEDVIRAMPEYVYDDKRSGATIAWDFFHPDEPRPTLLSYIEDDDLFLYRLPDTRAILTYLSVRPYSFETWDEFASLLDDLEKRDTMLDKARTYAEYFQLLVEYTAGRARLVTFEGHDVYFVSVNPLKPFVSALGNFLYTKHPPFSMLAHAHAEGFRISLRSDGSVNVAEIAQKYGGNGHPGSAAFNLPWGTPLPWVKVEHENPGH